ncbi:MAG: hypothetical protein CFE24_09990 [Flavobacterium sp. BFFFF2]|nr:MAG: hypothetical protein CFE24_09990 [Flavobacterium sp. BFFFF2]
MKCKSFSLILLVCFSTALTIAQVTTGNVKVYKPDGNKKANANAYKWTAKTDFVAMSVGEFPAIFEYRIADKFSVEGSAALTYGFISNAGLLNTKDESGYNDSYLKQQAGSGYAFRGAFKYYPSNDYDALEGWAFGVQAFVKNMKREYTDIDARGEKDVKVKTGLSLQITKQIFYDSNISYEWLIAIGYANSKRDYLEYDGTNGYVQKSTNDGSPNIQLGLRLGFGN